MSGGKLWRNSSGKLIASDGKLVLSESCPCIPVYDLYGTFNLRHEFGWHQSEPVVPDDIPVSTESGHFNIELHGMAEAPAPSPYWILSIESITGSSALVSYALGPSGLYPADWNFTFRYAGIPKTY